MEFPFSKGTRPKKARAGSIPTNIETLSKKRRHEKRKMSSLQVHAFRVAMEEKLAGGDTEGVTFREARAARKVLSQQKQRRLVGHGQLGVVGGAIAPAVAAASRGVKGFVDARGGIKKRLGGAARGVMSASAGDLAGQAVGGFLSGAALSKGREELVESGAKKRVGKFMQQRKGS